jgi:hypothetical protein
LFIGVIPRPYVGYVGEGRRGKCQKVYSTLSLW